MAAREALRLDAPFVDALHQRRHHRGRSDRRAGNVEISHNSELGIRHVDDEHVRRVRILDHVRVHLASAVVYAPFAVDFHHLGREGLLRRVWVQRFRPRKRFPEIISVASGHHDGGAFRGVRAHAADVIHVVMRQNQVTDRLAGISLLGHIDGLNRLAVVVRRFHGDQVRVGRDEKRIVRAALRLADIRRDVDELQRIEIIGVFLVRIVIKTRVLTTDDPLDMASRSRAPVWRRQPASLAECQRSWAAKRD